MKEHILEYQFNAEESKLFDLRMLMKYLLTIEERVKAGSL
jgi:hypothetical protein